MIDCDGVGDEFRYGSSSILLLVWSRHLAIAHTFLIHADRAQLVNMPTMSSPFATFLIVGRKIISLNGDSYLSWTIATNTMMQRHASSWESSSHRSLTTTISFGPRPHRSFRALTRVSPSTKCWRIISSSFTRPHL